MDNKWNKSASSDIYISSDTQYQWLDIGILHIDLEQNRYGEESIYEEKEMLTDSDRQKKIEAFEM